jgi:Fe-coproporphyrin III synthase
MPKVSINKCRVELPNDFLDRRHFPEKIDCWLSERSGELILNPCLPDIRKLYIEPTTACNLSCRTCIRNNWGMPAERMSFETFQHIADSLAELPSLKQVVFSGFGEPLTHPRILEMVEAVRRSKLSVTIATNGLRLDREMSAELVRLGVERINISVDGAHPQTFQDIRGAHLHNVAEHIHLLNETKRQLGSLVPSLGIEFVAMRSNVSEIKELAKLAS